MSPRALVVLGLVGGCWTAPAPPASPAPPVVPRLQEVVVRDAEWPFMLLADERYLYWVGGEDANEGIWRADKAPPSRAVRLASSTDARGLVLDGDRVWWGDGNAVRWVPKAGGTVRDVLVDLPHAVVDVVLDGSDLVVASNEASRMAMHITRYTTAGRQLASVQVLGVASLVLPAREGLYVRTERGIVRVRRDGTVDTLVDEDLDIGPMTLDTDAVLFGAGEEIYRVARHGPARARSIARVEGGRVTDLAVDATHVYWGLVSVESADNAIYRAPKDGGAARVVTRVHGTPDSVLVDGEHVYWSDAEHGLVVRRRRDGRGR